MLATCGLGFLQFLKMCAVVTTGASGFKYVTLLFPEALFQVFRIQART